MDTLSEISLVNYPLIILVSGIIFTIAWSYDVRLHKTYVIKNRDDLEMRTHRLILMASIVMMISLVLMYWFRMAMLPLFIASYFTRTAQELIDENHFHTNRCTFLESTIHLIMWIAIHTQTIALFIWGFYLKFNNFNQLHPLYYFGFAVIVISQVVNSHIEWNQTKS